MPRPLDKQGRIVNITIGERERNFPQAFQEIKKSRSKGRSVSPNARFHKVYESAGEQRAKSPPREQGYISSATADSQAFRVRKGRRKVLNQTNPSSPNQRSFSYTDQPLTQREKCKGEQSTTETFRTQRDYNEIPRHPNQVASRGSHQQRRKIDLESPSFATHENEYMKNMAPEPIDLERPEQLPKIERESMQKSQ